MKFQWRLTPASSALSAAAVTKTPSTTTQWTWALGRAPKRWMKATAPIRAARPAPAAPVQSPLHRAQEEVQRQGLHGRIVLQEIA